MKKLLIGIFAVLLVGTGCAKSDSIGSDDSLYEPAPLVVQPIGPQPAHPEDNPDVSVQGEWAGFVLSVAERQDCTEARAYLTPSLRSDFTEEACHQMNDYIMTVPSIDWSRTVTATSKKIVTLKDYEGRFFAEYLLGEDGAWYLNTAVWVR